MPTVEFLCMDDTHSYGIEDLYKSSHGLASPAHVIIGLSSCIVALIIIAVAMYWYKRYRKRTLYKKFGIKRKPKLKIALPGTDLGQVKIQKQPRFVVSSPGYVKDLKRENAPAIPDTVLTRNHNLMYPESSDSATRPSSLSPDSIFVNKDRDADDLWRLAVKKASQFHTTKPKKMKKISHCANGKIKFALIYNQLGTKELTVKILDFIDLPLSRETGYSVPFVKVYLYPQAAHSFPLPEATKNGFRVETMSFPRENSCSFISCPFDKLCSSALKFVILDYDRFSRSEFVAECVIQLDEVSLEGEAISRHLSIQRTNHDKDLGSLLISLCYQPNASRMCIIVLKASGLPDGDGGHIPDHYVKISLMCNGSILDKRRTRTIKKSVCPVFNERLTFPVDCHGVRSLVLIFDVIRYDSKIKQEKIATVVLGNHTTQRQVTPHEIQHFNEMLMSPQRQIAEWHKLIE